MEASDHELPVGDSSSTKQKRRRSFSKKKAAKSTGSFLSDFPICPRDEQRQRKQLGMIMMMYLSVLC